LDELYEQAGTPIEKRVPLFERNRDVVAQRDDAQNRAIGLEIAAGKYDDAIRMMTGRAFAAVEGANLNVAEHWTDAHLMRGRAKLTAQQYREALSDFETAITLPSNLPAGLGFSEGAAGGMRAPEFAYWTGMTYEAMGDRAKATEVWNRGAAALQGGSGRRGGGAGGAGAQSYYQALCLQKSGQSEKATALFQSLVDSGQAMVRAQPSNTGGGRGGFGRPQPTRIRQANGHYLAGLGYLGLNDARKAKAELTEAVQTSPDLLGARTTLATLN
jgi:tetratricopeptide (TPR) repeat protein